MMKSLILLLLLMLPICAQDKPENQVTAKPTGKITGKVIGDDGR